MNTLIHQQQLTTILIRTTDIQHTSTNKLYHINTTTNITINAISHQEEIKTPISSWWQADICRGAMELKLSRLAVSQKPELFSPILEQNHWHKYQTLHNQ